GLKRAVASFLQQMPPGSRVAVVAFNSEIDVFRFGGEAFTSDASAVPARGGGLTPRGATRYYDAGAQALTLLPDQAGRRAILALTDGEDTFSQDATLETVVTRARTLGLPIHTLGLGTEDEIEAESLKRMAAQTRGQYYPARETEQLKSIFEELALNLRE